MREYQYSYRTEYTYGQPVSRYNFLLRCQPWSGGSQRLQETQVSIRHSLFGLGDQVRFSRGIDGWGANICYGYVPEYHDSFVSESKGIVQMVTQYYEMPFKGNSYIFVADSILTASTLDMRILASDYAGTSGTDLDKALRICDFVHHYIEFSSGSTTFKTTASESFRQRKGVCQDLAHIMISMCRSVGISVRYVNGLTVGEGQTHAWVEVLSQNLWFGVDPTANKLIDHGYIKIAHGRDASDCPVNCGTFYGIATQNTFVRVSVNEV